MPGCSAGVVTLPGMVSGVISGLDGRVVPWSFTGLGCEGFPGVVKGVVSGKVTGFDC